MRLRLAVTGGPDIRGDRLHRDLARGLEVATWPSERRSSSGRPPRASVVSCNEFLRKHVSFANVVALTALVFSMGGTAIAANHYLITKTSQIKPSVLKALKVPGKTGAAGAPGAVRPARGCG